MKSLVKLTSALVVALTLTGVAYGQIAVTARPNQLPAGAYVNGADGDHYFFQSVEFVADGTPAGATEWLVELPDGITVADIDELLGIDEIYIQNAVGVGVAATLFIASPSASSFIVDVTAIGGFVAADVITVLFPVETSQTPASDLTYTVTATLGGVSTPGTSNPVAIVSSVSLANFDGIYLADADAGKITTNVRGSRHPDDAGAGSIPYTAAMPNLLVDLVGVAAGATVNAVDNWLPGVALYNNVGDNDGEITYQLWASQTAGLARVANGTGELAEDASTGAAFAAVSEAAAVTSAAAATAALDASILADTTWFFYITSDASNGWVLASSDTLDVLHHPSFVDITVTPSLVAAGANVGRGDGIDYDHDGIFEPTVAVGVGTGNGDNATATTLESGGTIGRDGLLVDLAVTGIGPDNPSFDSVDVQWLIEDLDDNARIYVFQSTNSAWTASDVTTAGGVVTDLGTADEVTSSPIYEEDPDNYATWKIYTSASDYEAAADYFLYIVAYDGENIGFRKVGTAAGASLTVTVKHFPYFKFHDMQTADDIPVDTDVDEYITISWGETIDGDKDADAAGTAVIKLYIVDEAGATQEYADIVAAGDPTSLASLTNLQNAGTLIANITDSSDTQEANRFMYDLRTAAPAAATYDFWAHITHLTDNLIVQYNSDLNPIVPTLADDRSYLLTHSPYLRPITPYAGPPVELDQADMFRMSWEAFDKAPTTTELVQVVLALEDVANPGGSDWDAWVASLTTNIVWVVAAPAVNGGVPLLTDGVVAADGSAIVNMSNITTTAGGGTPAAGNYDVYYFFTEKGVAGFDTETPVKAPGQVYLTNLTTAAYDIRLSPNKAHVAPGDILTVDIYASDDGSAPDPDKAVFTVLIPNGSYFTVVDQDATEDGIQPFDNDLGAVSGNTLNGEVLMNTGGLNASGEWALGYMEAIPDPGPPVSLVDVNMVSFQIEMTSVISDPLEDIEVVFGTDDPYVTNVFNDDGSPQSTSLPPVALALKLGQAGKLTGVVDVEGRVDKDQIVDFFVVPAGSVNPITTASFLTANSDADGSNGVQVTLQGGGYYELFGIPTGEYNIMVHKTRYANAIRENVRISSLGNVVENFVGARKLLGGDAAGYVDVSGNNIPDNRINAEDTQAIADARIGTQPGDSTWNTYADIDESGEIDVNDLFMAGKNIGIDGGGIFYKEIPGTNEEALVWLALVEETAEGITYAVRADKLASLSAFSAKLFIGSDEWEAVSSGDGLSEHTPTIHLSRVQGAEAIDASAVLGCNPVFKESMDLMTIMLRPLSANPAEPILTDVTLIDGNGVLSKAIISTEEALFPKEFALDQNFPNPFNPTTTISFSLPIEGLAKLAVYNLLGQEVRTLVSMSMDAGTYKAIWNSRDNSGRRVTSGIYFYRLTVDNQVVATHKMVLLK